MTAPSLLRVRSKPAQEKATTARPLSALGYSSSRQRLRNPRAWRRLAAGAGALLVSIAFGAAVSSTFTKKKSVSFRFMRSARAAFLASFRRLTTASPALLRLSNSSVLASFQLWIDDDFRGAIRCRLHTRRRLPLWAFRRCSAGLRVQRAGLTLRLLLAGGFWGNAYTGLARRGPRRRSLASCHEFAAAYETCLCQLWRHLPGLGHLSVGENAIPVHIGSCERVPTFALGGDILGYRETRRRNHRQQGETCLSHGAILQAYASNDANAASRLP
jgi:hypothetical protein